jgi:hypothetical protein
MNEGPRRYYEEMLKNDLDIVSLIEKTVRVEEVDRQVSILPHLKSMVRKSLDGLRVKIIY